MRNLLSPITIAIILGWVGFAITGLFLPLPLAVLTGVAVGTLSVTLLRNNIAIKGFIALMGPTGVVLPLLALRHVVGQFGIEIQVFRNAELVIFLLAYAAFLAASMGYLPMDAYRLGYAPVPVGVMVLALCVYGALTGDIFIPLVAVMAQVFWLKGWGSSNWFDHLLHATLIPMAIIVLAARLL